MALGPSTAGLLAQTMLTGSTPLLLYTVPSGKITILQSILANIIANTSISYYIGGNTARYLHLPATIKEAGQQFIEKCNFVLAAGTTIYGACTTTGDCSIQLNGEEWNV